MHPKLDLCLRYLLIVGKAHFIHVETVSGGNAVAIELNRVGELVIAAGKKRVVLDIDGSADAINGERIVKDEVRAGIVVKLSQNVVPGARREPLQRDGG